MWVSTAFGMSAARDRVISRRACERPDGGGSGRGPRSRRRSAAESRISREPNRRYVGVEGRQPTLRDAKSAATRCGDPRVSLRAATLSSSGYGRVRPTVTDRLPCNAVPASGYGRLDRPPYRRRPRRPRPDSRKPTGATGTVAASHRNAVLGPKETPSPYSPSSVVASGVSSGVASGVVVSSASSSSSSGTVACGVSTFWPSPDGTSR